MTVGPDAAPPTFGVARLPRLVVGPGRIAELPALVASFGRSALLVTGARSFLENAAWAPLVAGLATAGVAWDHVAIAGEPSPGVVDGVVAARRADPPEVVVGIGGGSALDAAKAIAGLLRSDTTALDHLEGVGRGIPYPGPATPFLAVPTTAGTGSEVTKNAVLSGRLPGPATGEPTPGGSPFKKSFRDELLVAQVAILDPDLLAGCPPALVAGDGMDAVTQLLEAFTSTGASPFTDAVARAGLEAAAGALPTWYAAAAAGAPPEASAAARTGMSWAACCSGIALANAGLGAVHGIVAALGARYPVPHGTGCGILLAATTRANLAALAERAPGSPALARYAEAGRILGGDPTLPSRAARAALVATLDGWTVALAIPRLADYGAAPRDLPGIVDESRGSSMRTNPVVLTDAEIADVLAACL
ncbi:MAG TPA: iron-containing alcohol dehydrogenase [Candidatus Nanopelagicales bacterium]|nr:iron-containing alcohol dehydrogenase [Candidatus Nanopelagicales bacterium]